MREILFRGKRTDNGEWVEGSYVYASIEEKGKSLVENAIKRHWIITQNGKCYEVDPSTVGQYTGLTDKNGKKIFEGDILDTTNSNSRIWYVDYRNTAFCCDQGNANYSCVLDDFTQVSDVEVIGNIHDNPELLEVSGDE